ncbi:MAG: hypothetical protein II857_10780 [Selenomonadaceae bacterium]|nr:hypothetical protein [Selenomonadaceae bacterium]
MESLRENYTTQIQVLKLYDTANRHSVFDIVLGDFNDSTYRGVSATELLQGLTIYFVLNSNPDNSMEARLSHQAGDNLSAVC